MHSTTSWSTSTCCRIGRYHSCYWSGREVDDPSVYWPLCLINKLMKLFKRMLVVQLTDNIPRNSFQLPVRFSDRHLDKWYHQQRNEYSISVVVGSRYRRYILVLIYFDIRNVFNSLLWSSIFELLAGKSVYTYLKRVIQSYICHRTINTSSINRRDMFLWSIGECHRDPCCHPYCGICLWWGPEVNVPWRCCPEDCLRQWFSSAGSG